MGLAHTHKWNRCPHSQMEPMSTLEGGIYFQTLNGALCILTDGASGHTHKWSHISVSGPHRARHSHASAAQRGITLSASDSSLLALGLHSPQFQKHNSQSREPHFDQTPPVYRKVNSLFPAAGNQQRHFLSSVGLQNSSVRRSENLSRTERATSPDLTHITKPIYRL